MANQKKKHTGQSGEDGNDELRTKVIKFSVSPSEFQDLVNQYSKTSHSTLAQYCREKSLSKAIQVKKKDDLKINHATELYQLSKIGTNINQIARRLNTGEVAHKVIAELTEELEEFRRLKKQIFQQSMRGATL